MAVSTEGLFAQMKAIRASALRHNRALGVNAALIYRSGWFVYWAEGPANELLSVVERVRADVRHHSVRLLHRSDGPVGLHSPWSMLVSNSAESAQDFGRRVLELRNMFDQGRQLRPTSIVRRLSAPLRIGGAEASLNESFHRVGVCSAASGGSFDLVRWLAAKNAVPFEMRRTSGEDDNDSADEYIEFMNDGWPCRVIAIARQSLLHGLRRAFLPDWSHLILLLSGVERHDDALIKRVSAACLGLETQPTLVGFATSAQTHHRMARAAAATGLTYIDAAGCLPGNFEEVWSFMSGQLRSMSAPAASTWSDPFSSP